MAAPVNVLLGLQGHRDRGGVFRHTGEGYCEYRVYCMCGMRSRTIAPYTHIRIYTYTHGEVIVIVIVIAILITNLSGSKGDAVPRGVSEIHVPVCV